MTLTKSLIPCGDRWVMLTECGKELWKEISDITEPRKKTIIVYKNLICAKKWSYPQVLKARKELEENKILLTGHDKRVLGKKFYKFCTVYLWITCG